MSQSGTASLRRYHNHVYVQNTSYSRFSGNTIYGTYPNYNFAVRSGSHHNVIENMLARDGYDGVIILDGSNYNLINNITSINNTDGVYLTDSSYNNITNSRAIGSYLYGYGITGTSSNNRLVGNNATATESLGGIGAASSRSSFARPNSGSSRWRRMNCGRKRWRRLNGCAGFQPTGATGSTE